MTMLTMLPSIAYTLFWDGGPGRRRDGAKQAEKSPALWGVAGAGPAGGVRAGDAETPQCGLLPFLLGGKLYAEVYLEGFLP